MRPNKIHRRPWSFPSPELKCFQQINPIKKKSVLLKMKNHVTIDAGADIEQTEGVGLKARQNKNISIAVTRL